MEGGSAHVRRAALRQDTVGMIPTKGFYRVRIRAAAEPGVRRKPVRLNLIRNGGASLLKTIVDASPESPASTKRLRRWTPKGATRSRRCSSAAPDSASIRRPAVRFERAIEEAGRKKDFATVQRLAGRKLAEGLIASSRPNPEAIDTSGLPKLYLDWIEIEGPLYDQWPPRSHEILLFRGSGAHTGPRLRTGDLRALPAACLSTPCEAGRRAIVRLVAQELAARASRRPFAPA